MISIFQNEFQNLSAVAPSPPASNRFDEQAAGIGKLGSGLAKLQSVEGQNELLDKEFLAMSNINLSNAYLSLQRTGSLGYHIPMKTLHEEFIRQTCIQQLLVV